MEGPSWAHANLYRSTLAVPILLGIFFKFKQIRRSFEVLWRGNWLYVASETLSVAEG
jgi:hypothetical protein